MAKAKFIGKTADTSYGQCKIYLEYEYRGKTYTVMEDRQKGNEPLAWQHRSNQDYIDRILDTPVQTTGKPVDLDDIWAEMGWDN